MMVGLIFVSSSALSEFLNGNIQC